MFSAIANGDRKVLIIDEFSYMARMDDGFLIKFQGIYDEILKDSGLMTILCGSHMHIMNDLSENESSPLYGRFDRRIVLWPLDFFDMPSCGNVKDDIERYSVHGGIPRYMELLGGDELEDDIRYKIMDPSSMMFSDPTVLLNSDVGGSNVYLSLLKAIAYGNHRLSEISSFLEIPVGTLPTYLSRLIEMGMVRKEVPVTETDIEKSKKGRYLLSDHFTQFWFRFVYPYRSSLIRNDDSYAMVNLRKDFIQRHVSFVFEDICRDELRRSYDRIGFIPERVGRFWNRNIEIDVAAIDDQSKKVFLGECKYHRERPMDVHELNELRSKVGRVAEIRGYDVVFGLFSVTGFDKALETEDVILFDMSKSIQN